MKMPRFATMYTLMTSDAPPPADRAHRRLGGFMIAAAWLVVIGILVMLFGGLLESQYNPNPQPVSEGAAGGPVRVSLRQNRMGHYVAGGSINGEPVVFLLDTGATQVSVPADLAARLGLERGAPMASRTANGVITTYATTLSRVQLGDIVLRGVRASINPGMRGDEVLLGMSFLRELDFNQRDGTLTLIQRQAG